METLPRLLLFKSNTTTSLRSEANRLAFVRLLEKPPAFPSATRTKALELTHTHSGI